MPNARTNHQPRAAIYVRVSTGPQEDGTSLDSQEDGCRRYAAERGLAVDEAHVYREVHTGGEVWERPEVSRLRQAIMSRAIDFVIVYAIDRLARDQDHQGLLFSEARYRNVQIVSVTEDLDSSFMGRVTRTILGLAAEEERRKILERTLRGKRSKLEKGQLCHGRELFGYRRDKEAGVRIIHETEAAIIRRIYEMAASGNSIRRIARTLNTEAILTPAAAKNGAGCRSAESLWSGRSVRRLLLNPAYKGETYEWRWKVDPLRGFSVPRPESEWVRLPDGVTPPIVSADVWDAVKARIGDNGVTTRNEQRPYLLRGHIYCAVCGYRLGTCMAHGRRAYRCHSRYTAEGHCGAKQMTADDIELWVWERITAALSDPRLIEHELEKRRAAGPEPGATAEVAHQRQELAKAEAGQQRLLSLFAAADDEAFPQDAVMAQLRTIERRKAAIAERITELERRQAQEQALTAQIASVSAFCASVSGQLDDLDFDGKRLALQALDVRVVANGCGRRGSPKDWRITGVIPLDAPADGSLVGVLAARC
jgi:site-specific DNA recombinase